MTVIYLIRHAEAEGNVYRRCHGQYNSLVTARGLRQIAELSMRFRDEKISAVYSSDLYRTMKTASAIFEPQRLPLRTDVRLREIGMGVWEDITFGDLQKLETEYLVNLNNNPWAWAVEGSEAYADVQNRMIEALTEISERHDGETVAVFSHGMAIRAFTCGILGVTDEAGLQKIKHLDNTAISEFEYTDGAFTLHSYNDNSHLSEGNSTLAGQKWVQDKKGLDDTNINFNEISSGMYTLTVGGEECGVLELDADRLADEGVGVVTRYKLSEGYRGSGLGIQLLGQAVSDYRKLGRRRLRVELTPEFEGNAGFFEKLGFMRVSPGAVEMDIFIPDIGDIK